MAVWLSCFVRSALRGGEVAVSSEGERDDDDVRAARTVKGLARRAE
jgi:hypothetical protein